MSSGGEGPAKLLVLVDQYVSLSVGELLVFVRTAQAKAAYFFVVWPRLTLIFRNDNNTDFTYKSLFVTFSISSIFFF